MPDKPLPVPASGRSPPIAGELVLDLEPSRPLAGSKDRCSSQRQDMTSSVPRRGLRHGGLCEDELQRETE